MENLEVRPGVQSPEEVKESIKKMGEIIGNSDMTSTFITDERIRTMREYLFLLENYNYQLRVNRKEV